MTIGTRFVFVDTGAWVALRSKRDQYHAGARSIARRIKRGHVGLITTEWVFAEAVTLLKARGAVQSAIDLGETLQAGQLGEVVQSTPELRRNAWELFGRYRDLPVSWVDCASFAVMRLRGISEFFGFDEDFVRAGFTMFRQ
ncbi:MAG: type II toxin-antitoxin system VapC family toxin [Chloroflexi bacterium]|nr:type II toxin-antitoxin system VapC family toxin [Chloroflexota bacterium]